MALAQWIAVTAAMVGLSASASICAPVDFEFHDQSLRSIFEHIARVGEFGVKLDPALAERTALVKLKQIEPIDAMFIISRVYSCRVKREGPIDDAKRRTYRIVYDPSLPIAGCRATGRSIQLKYARAEDATRAVERAIPAPVNVVVSAESSMNKVLIRGSDDGIGAAAAIVCGLETAARQSAYVVPRSCEGQVTTDDLFRLGLDGL